MVVLDFWGHWITRLAKSKERKIILIEKILKDHPDSLLQHPTHPKPMVLRILMLKMETLTYSAVVRISNFSLMKKSRERPSPDLRNWGVGFSRATPTTLPEAFASQWARSQEWSVWKIAMSPIAILIKTIKSRTSVLRNALVVTIVRRGTFCPTMESASPVMTDLKWPLNNWKPINIAGDALSVFTSPTNVPLVNSHAS